MATRRKVYPVKNVTNTPFPHLIYNYDPETGRGPLHISDKSCTHGPNDRHKNITRCRRIMNADYRYPASATDNLDLFRLCQRCGSKPDFIQAETEGRVWRREFYAQQETKRQRETEEREAAWAATVSRINELAQFFIALDLRVGVSNGVILFDFDGYQYKATEVGPIVNELSLNSTNVE